MELKDKIKVAEWLNAGVSLRDVENSSCIGLVDNVRFTPEAKRVYRLIWEWSAMRLSSHAQDLRYRQCGMAGINRRIERCRRIVLRVFGYEFKGAK